MIALRGVRRSWLISVKKRERARTIASATARARSSSVEAVRLRSASASRSARGLTTAESCSAIQAMWMVADPIESHPSVDSAASGVAPGGRTPTMATKSPCARRVCSERWLRPGTRFTTNHGRNGEVTPP